VGGAGALLAYLALPWVTYACRASDFPEDPRSACAAIAAAQNTYPVESLGPVASTMLGLPLSAYLTAQITYLGPAALCLLATLPALVAHRSAPWRRAGVALGVVGGFYGGMSPFLLPFLFSPSAPRFLIAHRAVGFYVAVTGFALTLLGVVLLGGRYAYPFDFTASGAIIAGRSRLRGRRAR